MIPILAIGITLIAGAITVHNWRYGVLAMLFVGMLGDPFRKLTAGLPGYYIMWTAVLFGLVWLVAMERRQIVPLSWLALGDRRMKAIGRWLLVLILLQAAHALVRWGNPAIPVLGLIFYLGPMVALAVGWSYSRNLDDVRRFLLFYGGLAAAFAMTVYLSSDYEASWPVLSEVGFLQGGRQLMIYDVGTVLKSYSGLFRVGEIAAWHAATAAIFLMILALDRSSVLFRILVAVVVMLLVGAIFMTGRRKMLMALTVFMAFQWALLAMLHKVNGKLVAAGLLIGLAGSVMLTLMRDSTESSLYLERGGTVFESVDDRLSYASDLLTSAFYRGSGVGLGVGVTSQGTAHVGASVWEAGGSGEAGVGKIMIELGVVGFVLIIALLVAFTRRVWAVLKIAAKYGSRQAMFAASLLSFLIANIATFTVATQLYSDPFVMILLGMTGGMMLGILHRSLVARQGASEVRRG